MIEQIDPAATEMYLAHAEPGMKRAYAQRNWSRLDRALKKMEKRLSDVLTLPCDTGGPEGPPVLAAWAICVAGSRPITPL